MNPPANIPLTKNRFQASFYQLYLKNGIFAGTHMAHTCLREADTPKVLFPESSSRGTMSPISGPETYHGHGCEMNLIIDLLFKLLQRLRFYSGRFFLFFQPDCFIFWEKIRFRFTNFPGAYFFDASLSLFMLQYVIHIFKLGCNQQG
jgi:hypothetical protein